MSVQPRPEKSNGVRGFRPQWTLADKLRKARELTGLTTGEFAAEMGISRNSAGRAERGEVVPRRTTLMAWAMRTGVDFEWLTENEETPSPGGNGVSDPADTAPARKEWAPRDSNPKPAD